LVGDPAEGDVHSLDQAADELRSDRSSAGGAATLPRPEVVGYVGSGPGRAALVRLWWPGGRAEVSPPFTARHRLQNVVSAAAACYAAGLELSTCLEGLQHVDFSPHRGDEVMVAGVCLIDDTYNANPPAMRCALDTLVVQARTRGGRSIALLGDMLELGPGADAYHVDVGLHAAQAEVEVLWGVGPKAQSMVEGYVTGSGTKGFAKPRWFADAEADDLRAALGELVAGLSSGDVVLVKASRGMRLERLVDALRSELQRREG
jgi:UDP-N-acetylmuramoyl-tripeptide--D-alanyl-D-alanine ligase